MSIKKEMLICFDEICKLSGIENSVLEIKNNVDKMYCLINQLPNPPMSKEEAKEAAFEYAKQFDATRILIVDGCYQVSCFNINGIWEEKEVFPFEY